MVLLCSTPTGKVGRPSKALSFAEAESLLRAAEGSTMGAYVVLSLLTGARTEELRALTWTHVDLDGDAHATPPVPPHIMVWRSVRTGGDTKPESRAAPWRCVSELRAHRTRQTAARRLVGDGWQDNDLVFASDAGTTLDAQTSSVTAVRTCDAASDGSPCHYSFRGWRQIARDVPRPGVPVAGRGCCGSGEREFRYFLSVALLGGTGGVEAAGGTSDFPEAVAGDVDP